MKTFIADVMNEQRERSPGPGPLTSNMWKAALPERGIFSASITSYNELAR